MAWALALVGCSHRSVEPGSVDGGATDLGRCVEIKGMIAITTNFLTPDGCDADRDCMLVPTRCGLGMECGRSIYGGGTWDLDQWLVEWDARGCSAGLACSPCPD